MFEKVLVCLDGSSLSEQILPYIAAESGRLGKVVMLRVQPLPDSNLRLGIPGEPGAAIRTRGSLERYQKEAQEISDYLEKTAQPLREAGLDVECVVLQGNASELIISYARENDVRLIAIATHGITGLRQVVLGSTAEHVLRHSGLPLLLITPRK